VGTIFVFSTTSASDAIELVDFAYVRVDHVERCFRRSEQMRWDDGLARDRRASASPTPNAPPNRTVADEVRNAGRCSVGPAYDGTWSRSARF